MRSSLQKSVCLLLAACAPLWGFPVRVMAQESTVLPVNASQDGPSRDEVLKAAEVEAIPVRLGGDRYLRGVVKTKAGQPAAGAPVVLGVRGKPVGRVIADDSGQFAFGPIKPGKYQVATRDAAAMLAVYSVAEAPVEAASNVEVSQQAMIARGQSPSGFLTNPWFIGLVVAAAIAIPLAIVLSDDDDDAS